MATHFAPLINWKTKPDGSGNVSIEPFSVAATNDQWDDFVIRFKDTSTRIGLYCSIRVPPNYNASGTSGILIEWSTPNTSNDVEWDVDYRAVGGDDSESLDQSGTQESVNNNDTAPGAAWRRLECLIPITAGNLAAGDRLQLIIFRDGTDAGDTLNADAFLFDAFLQYTD